MDHERERLRAELLAAAEQEAASILEDARREITVTARRAHRDLLLIRAQLRLCGIEPGQIGATGLDPSYLEPEAALEAADVSVPVAAEPVGADSPAHPPAARAPRRTLTRASAIAGLLVPLMAGGVVGWHYVVGSGASPVAVAGGSSAATREPASTPPPVAPAAVDPGAPAQGAVTSPARVLVQTLRPVWMRLDVDGVGDAGRLYPAGETTALNPRQSLLIRAGDAGAVMLAVNGAPMVALGPDGQVMTRRIVMPDGAAPAPPPAANADRPAAPISAAPIPAVPAASGTGASAGHVAPAPPSSATVPAPAPGMSAPAPRTHSPSAASVTDSDQHALITGHSQWLDAYARNDQRTIAALTIEGFSVRDERAGRNGAPPGGISPAQVSDVRVDVAGGGAVLTARVRASVDGVATESLLSEVWVRRDMQRWGLMGVRITPVENLPASIR